jgi:2,3-bisphosphoglycerate-independent phosphoglycerate mutase
MSSVLLIFVDGLGIGTRGAHNPLARLDADASPLAIFADEEPRLPHDGVLVRTDSCLGVEGRPQSASGQTTILTGVNAPATLGYHKQGFPNEALREIIDANSIFLQLQRAGVAPVTFANAYTPRFFNSRPRWVSATTTAVEAAHLTFRTLEDLRAGRAVYQDFTNEMLIESGFDVSPRTPEEAAQVLAHVSAENRFTLYEYFLTDRAGHAQDEAAAHEILSNLARFVRATLARVDLITTTVILTSDHGNIEDLSVRNHTRNFVPTLAWGAGRERVRECVRSLADITPTIIQILTAQKATHP